MSSKALLHLGSNEGDRKRFIQMAINQCDKLIGKVVASSSMYETAAWGKTNQPAFLNCCIVCQTALKPSEVLGQITKIEEAFGRSRTERWGQRTLDIDILLIDDKVIDTKDLTIPHGLMHKRNFVLVPAMEIAGEWVHPVLKETVEALFVECEDEGEVVLLTK